MDTKIKPQDLLPCDVLLYNSTSLISELIKMFDGSEYSHCAIYNNGNVLEAIAEGVKQRTLSVSVEGAKYVDVYRFISSDGKKIGDPAYPANPIIERIDYYKNEGDRYAYEQLLLLALLTSVRRISIPFIGWLLRTILDTAASILSKIISLGKEPMICSELVYRCFVEAGAKYKLTIPGADTLKSMNLLPSVAAYFPKTDLNDQIIDKEMAQLNSQIAEFLAMYSVSKKSIPKSYEDFSIESAVNLLAVPDFVTPRDLKQSPNLYKVGTLELV